MESGQRLAIKWPESEGNGVGVGGIIGDNSCGDSQRGYSLSVNHLMGKVFA